MTVGEKIKSLRRSGGMTQEELTRGGVTRNMLSAIESGKASPSLETLQFLADKLSVPTSYLLSEEDDLFFYQKKELIQEIKRLFSERKYKDCIKHIKTLSDSDDELEYILALCYFELGKRAVLGGSLKSGREYLTLSMESVKKTVYDTERIECATLIYIALATNIQSPLLEFDKKEFDRRLGETFENDFYKYLIADTSYDQQNPLFSKHLKAKELIKERKYSEAITLLSSIENEKTPESYNAYLIFSLYTDLESCYKQLADFESAYRYASKRLSIIEGFKL